MWRPKLSLGITRQLRSDSDPGFAQCPPLAEALKSGTTIKLIAADNACSDSYARRIIPLATLSRKLQEAILSGSQPTELTLETLIRTRIPFGWAAQESRFGLTK